MISVIRKVLDFAKKALIVVVVYIIVINLFFYFINKDKPKTAPNSPSQSSDQVYQTLNDPKLNSTKEGKMALNTYRAVLCRVVGEACTDNPADDKENFHDSLAGFFSNILLIPYSNPPASGLYWAYSGLQNSGFIPKTYAAGIGFNALLPFKEIWMMFRNFVMMLMVLIIIAIGFMIMFRAKINPQTVISIENSLPKIVIAMILITFSYAIAGFLIDLMYVVIGFVITLFSTNPNFGFSPTDLFNKYYFKSNTSPLDALSPVGFTQLWSVSGAVYNLLPDLLKTILNTVVTVLFTKLGLAFFGKKFKIGFLTDLTTKLATHIKGAAQVVVSLIAAIILFVIEYIIGDLLVSWITMGILTAVLGFSLLFIYFRIFFLIFSVYLNTILLIMFAPLILAFEAIPGKSAFSPWFKNLLVNLMTFPIIVAITLISSIIIKTPTESKMLWRPPYLVGFNPDIFKTIVASGLIFMIPDLVKTFKELIGVKPLPVGLNIGSFFAGGQAAGGGAMSILGMFSSINLGMAGMRGLGLIPPTKDRTGLTGAPGAETAKAAQQAATSLPQAPPWDTIS